MMVDDSEGMEMEGWRLRGRGGGGVHCSFPGRPCLYLLSAAVAMTTTTAAAVTALLPFSPFPPSLSPSFILLIHSFSHATHHLSITSLTFFIYLFFLCLSASSSLSLGSLLLSIPSVPVLRVKNNRDARMAVVFHPFFFLNSNVCVPLAGSKLEITNGVPSPQTTKHSGMSECSL